VRAAEKTPDVQQALDTLGYGPSDKSPSEFAHFVAGDIQDWAAAVKAAGLKPQ
jgi:tripartite-type tricarboxylate transporter receptor subunit TctC